VNPSDDRVEQLARQLEWDSQFFSLEIARVTAPSLGAADWSLLLAWCRRQGVRCFYYEIASDDPIARRLAEEHGCHLADVRITFEHPAPSQVAKVRKSEAVVTRTAGTKDLPALEAIAREIAVVSRFHRDPGFPRGAAAAMYARWVRGAYEHDPSALLVAELSGEVAGFLACKRRADWGQIDLVGVREMAQRHGVGRALVRAALRWTADRGLPAMRVVTQAHNVPAQRFYQGMGFRTVAVTLLYHRWFEEP